MVVEWFGLDRDMEKHCAHLGPFRDAIAVKQMEAMVLMLTWDGLMERGIGWSRASMDERLMRDKKKDESAHITDLTPLHVRNLRARTPNLENCICIMHFVHTS